MKGYTNHALKSVNLEIMIATQILFVVVVFVDARCLSLSSSFFRFLPYIFDLVLIVVLVLLRSTCIVSYIVGLDLLKADSQLMLLTRNGLSEVPFTLTL